MAIDYLKRVLRSFFNCCLMGNLVRVESAYLDAVILFTKLASQLLDSDTFKRMVAEIVSKPEDVLSLKEMCVYSYVMRYLAQVLYTY